MPEKEVKSFDQSTLSDTERESLKFVTERIVQLQESRKNHYGVDLDVLWAKADEAYIPHRLKKGGKKVIATDEERGWRGSMVELGGSNWQSDLSQSNPFVKITTAYSILVDQNPSGVFVAGAKKYENVTELMKQLYEHSWESSKSKPQLKLFVHNLAKYGWSIARTYPRKSEVHGFNGIYRECLDPRNAWIDDMTKPNNPFSQRDWAWRKVYSMDSFEEEFGKYERAKLVQAGGNTEETIANVKGNSNEKKETDLVEVLFYENLLKDLFMVIANGVPVIIEKLPVADARGLKKLSCWHTYWNLRHAESPFGIGIWEAIRYDQSLLDRIRNMTTDQLTMSIYKMGFYQGTNSLSDTGEINIRPGVLKQALDPKNTSWLEIPGPGKDAWAGLEMFKKDLDEASGITDPLLGVVTGKTAFELAQAKEGALKRLKAPLDNILDALNTEGYITVSLIQLLYSIPETIKVTDQALIDAYLKDVQSDPELWGRDKDGVFEVKLYPEFPLNLEKDENDNLVESAQTRFFRVRPKFLNWEGVIIIKAQSILTPSKQIDKALELEMWTTLIPMFVQPPELYSKPAKSICKLYEKDYREILPDSWIELLDGTQKEESLFVSKDKLIQDQMMQMQEGGQAGQVGQDKTAKMAMFQQPSANPMQAANPQSMIGKITSRLTAPFRKI